MSDIVRCTCKHPFQDSMYGIGNRVTTPMKSGQGRCTVCGTVHGSQTIVKVAKAPVVPQEIVKVEKKPDADKKPGPKMSKKKSDVKDDKKKDDKKKDDKKKSMKGGKR